MTGPFLYLAELARGIARGWDRFFFTPADPTPLGLMRILVGALLFWSLLVTGLDLQGFLGPHAWADPDAVRESIADADSWAWSFWLWVPDALLRPVWVLGLMILAAYTVGLGSRTTAVLAWVISASTCRRAPVMLYGFDHVVGVWAFYLAVCGASGQAVSLDRVIARIRRHRRALAVRPKTPWKPESGAPTPSVSANIGLRLVQLHLCLIYGLAGLAKLQGPAWWNGFAMWNVVATPEFRRFDLTPIVEWPLLLNLATHAAIAFELSYPILIWNRLARPLLIFTALVMHALIDVTLGLTEFALTMVAGNLAFCSGPWLRSLFAGRAEDEPAVRVLYDGACPVCRRSIAVCTALDPDRLIDPIDLNAVDPKSIHPSLTREACLAAMHVVDRRGRVTAGFDAVRTLLGCIPTGMPLAWLGYVPGVAPLGRRAYNAFAASRPRDLPCTDETCAIHPRRDREPAAAER